MMKHKLCFICLTALLFILPSLSIASPQSIDLVNEGRQLLFKNGAPTYQGIIDADDKFEAAVTEDGNDQEARVFRAVTRIAAFVLERSDGEEFQTFADIINAMGIPIMLDGLIDEAAPFGEVPSLAGQPNLPVTTPDGDDLRDIIHLGLIDVIDLALTDLEIVQSDIEVILTAAETDDLYDTKVDYTDVLLGKAFLNGVKTIASIISAYDLDGADLREIIALGNAEMIDLHPDLLNNFLTSHQNFLSLAENGASLLEQAKTSFLAVYDELNAAHASLENELSRQENQDYDLFTYESEEDEQEFENILSGLAELKDSLAGNRAATLQDIDSGWRVEVANDSSDSLILHLTRTLLGNGSYIYDHDDFQGTIGGNYINGWMSYWKIGNQIEIILDYWGYKRIVLTGTLINNETEINGTCLYMEFNVSDYVQTGEPVSFTASRDYFYADEIDKFDLNALFGNTASPKKDPLVIRKFLPDFDTFGEPIPGTFPEPVLNGLLPDYDTNQELVDDEDIGFDPLFQFFTIPQTSVDIKTSPDEWHASTHVTEDTYNEEEYFPEGLDIKDIYIAEDGDYLYMGMSLGGNPLEGQASEDYIGYHMDFREERHSYFNYNNFSFSAANNAWNDEWQVNIRLNDKNGTGSHIETYNASNGYVHAGDNFVAWKVPLSDIGGDLDKFGGWYLTASTWSDMYSAGDWVNCVTKLEPVYDISGTINVPDGYTGGKIYIYLSNNNYPTYGDDALIGTYIEDDGSFALTGAPYSSEDLYLHAFWDADGNGIRNSGDYTAMTNFTVKGNVDTGNIDLQNKISSLPLTGCVKSVHSGNNQFRTYFDILIDDDYQGSLPYDIDSITVTYPDGTNHQIYPDGGAVWDSYWNEFFLAVPGNPQLGEYKFTVTASDGSIGIATDTQKDLITIPIVDVNKVKINTGSKTPILSWEPVSTSGTDIAYRLEVINMAGDYLFRTGREYNMTSCAIPELDPGKQYQYRIRAVDDSDWIKVDNRSHTQWTTFTMDSTLTHSAVPAIDLYGWGAVEWSHVDHTPDIDNWINVIDHDGVAYDGSSHYVYARPIDEYGNLIGEQKIDLEFDYSKNETQGFYWGWINSEDVPENSEGVRFFAVDPDGITTQLDDVVAGIVMDPPENIGLECTVNDTTPAFTWNKVSGANKYRIRIYNENRTKTIWRWTAPNVKTYTVPPGVLEPETTYQYRLEARNSHDGFEVDKNIVFPAKDSSSDNYPKFTTGTSTDKPFIDVLYSGVETWSDNYRGTFTSFWIRVYDAQGAPGNIQKVKVTDPNGKTTELYYDYNRSDICAIYSNDSYEEPVNGTYSFEVTDKDGNQSSLDEELTVNPIGYPAESSLSVTVNGTGGQFDWDDVEGTDFYRLEIYNKDHERILKFATTESQYTLAPGFLEPGKSYGFRVTTRREFWDENTDNGSTSPWSSYLTINFKTEPVAHGTNQPEITTDNFGAVVMYLKHPKSGLPSYWLGFAATVTDNDGVPGNIKSVTVQGPGITEAVEAAGFTGDRLTLNYDWFKTDNKAEYWYSIMYDNYDDIPEGQYTFTVEDEDGNTATAADTLVKNSVPLVEYGTPAQDVAVSSDQPVFDWPDLSGGEYFYRVRIYQHWNRLIHNSEIFDASSYILPSGILKPDELYGYRLYAYDNDPAENDVDNYSINEIFFAKQNHFTISDLPPDWLMDAFKIIKMLSEKPSDIPFNSSEYYDLNQDGILDMQDALPMLQNAGELK